MIWKCRKCNKQWHYDVSKCIFCGGDVYLIHNKKYTVIGVTEVFVPSVEHEIVPYKVILLEDIQGNKLLKKTFENHKLGDSLVFDSMDKPDMIIGVVGAGTLGLGITHIVAERGYKVILKSRSTNSLNKGREKIKNWLLKTRSEEDVLKIIKNIDFTLDMKSLKTANIIIEAVTEDIEVKKQLFRELEMVCLKDTIFASNTSSLSITTLSSVVSNPKRVVGMHFFNPVQKMQLVEIIRGDNTDESTIEIIRDFITQLGKTYVVTIDTPGFIVNRVLVPLLNESIQILEEGNIEAKDIDTAIKLGLNHPMGPLALADLIGLDVCLSIMNRLYDGFGDDKYKANPLLLKLVNEGKLGRKTGSGFYES